MLRLIDLARACQQIKRFHGASYSALNVLQHQWLTYYLAKDAGAPEIVQLAALVHDLAEGVIGDLSYGAKLAYPSVRARLARLEAKVLAEIVGPEVVAAIDLVKPFDAHAAEIELAIMAMEEPEAYLFVIECNKAIVAGFDHEPIDPTDRDIDLYAMSVGSGLYGYVERVESMLQTVEVS